MMEAVESYLGIVEIVSYVILGLSCLASCKIVGLELFGVLQLAYWRLVPQEFLTIYSFPLTKFRPILQRSQPEVV